MLALISVTFTRVYLAAQPNFSINFYVHSHLGVSFTDSVTELEEVMPRLQLGSSAALTIMDNETYVLLVLFVVKHKDKSSLYRRNYQKQSPARP